MVKRLRKLCIFYGLFRCYFAGGLLFLVYRIRKEDSILFKHSAVFYKSRKTFYQKEEAMKNETTADQYVFVEQHSTSYNAAAWIQGFGGYLRTESRD